MSSGAALIALVLAAAVPDRLPPIDQCSGDPSFTGFRAELVRAVERRDVAAILAMVDDDVLIDFGPEGHGKAAFVKWWRLDRPATSGLWQEIKTIVRLGCTAENEAWQMPSFGNQLEGQLDPLETLLAIGPGWALRSEPRDDSSIAARLDWDILKLREVTDDEQWMLVGLRDGRSGYVRREQVRSPLDYRIGVQRVLGVLRITAFVAGD